MAAGDWIPRSGLLALTGSGSRMPMRTGSTSSVRMYRTIARSVGRRRARRGFTLIEMIVASILLFVGAVAAIVCISAATRSASAASEISTATLLAQKRIAELEVDTSQLSGGQNSGDFGGDYPSYHWDQNVETTDFTSLVKVTLTVSWSSGVRTNSEQFTTYEVLPPTTTGS